MPQFSWTLMKEFRFEASHQLTNHDGACARLHGHSYVGRVFIRGDALIQSGPKAGMVIDYGDISSAIKKITEGYLDHYHLNNTLDDPLPPTAEVISRWVYERLDLVLPGLVAVEIDETATSSCRYGER